MTREPLPNRRYNESSEFRHLGIRYAMQIGVYEDGRVGEVFLQMEKSAGTIADVNARDIAVLISMLIQYGAPLKRMLDAITKDENGNPEGLAGAVLAHLGAWKPERFSWPRDDSPIAPEELETARLPSGQDGGTPIPGHLLPQAHAMLRLDGIITQEAIDAEVARVRPMVTKESAKGFGYTGDQCTECQNFTMIRNGTCLKCDTCGTTTGCS